MIPGLGLLRRGVTLVLIGAAFMAGLKLGQGSQSDACRKAGGQWDTRGFCERAAP